MSDDDAVIARALAVWAAEAAELLARPDLAAADRERLATAVRRADMARRAGERAPTDAAVRDYVDGLIRWYGRHVLGPSAPWPIAPAQLRAERARREQIAVDAIRDAITPWLPGVALPDDEIRAALRAASNRGGRGQRAPIRLADALVRVHDRLGIAASGHDSTARRRRRRKTTGH